MAAIIEVFHHTQLIADLIGRGQLTFNDRETGAGRIPRSLLSRAAERVSSRNRAMSLAAAGATLLEMEKNGKDSFCCGAGGAQYWKEEEHGSEAVNLNRFAQAQATGASTLAVGCPFCATMMIDANREEGEPMRVLDVAEIVADALAKETVS